MYSIGQLSKKTNISVRALRYYDEIGLLKPANVADSGYRYYSNEEAQTLRHITALKELGFTLSSIKELLTSEKELKEDRWKSYIEFELEAIANERKRLDNMERLLRTTHHAFEMKGKVDPDNIFLFIQSIQRPLIDRQSFLDLHFTNDEIDIIENLPNLSTNDPRNMEWAKLCHDVKQHLHEPPSSEISQELAKSIVEISGKWFQDDEHLVDKYWELIRPDKGEQAKVFGMDAETMDYIDKILDYYILNIEKESQRKEGGI